MTVELIDETWRQYGSHDKYDLALARRELTTRTGSRENAEATVTAMEATLARVTGPDAGKWSDSYMVTVYEKELADARARLDRLKAAEDAQREVVQRLQDAVKPPRRLTDADHALGSAERELARLEARPGQIDAELAGVRDRISALCQEATGKDAVAAARTAVQIAEAEEAAVKLRAKKDKLPGRIEWQRAWVELKRAVVDGDDGVLAAALDALDEVGNQ